MELLISHLVSAFVGLITGVILEEPLTLFRDNLLRRIRSQFREGLRIPVPFQFTFGSIEAPFVMVDGDGQAEYMPKTIVCHYDLTPMPLPPEIEEIKARIEAQEEAKRLAGEPYDQNGRTYALKRYTRGRTPGEENIELNQWFGPSDWFTFLATNMSLDHEHVLDPETGRKLTLPERYFAG